MESRPRFSMSSLLVATTLTAAWCGLFVARHRFDQYLSRPPGMHANEVIAQGSYYALLVSLPALIVGVFARRPILGSLCGLACGAAMVLIYLGAVYHF